MLSGPLPCGRYLLAPFTGNQKGSISLWYSELGLHQLGSRPTFIVPRWTAHLVEVVEEYDSLHQRFVYRVNLDQWARSYQAIHDAPIKKYI